MANDIRLGDFRIDVDREVIIGPDGSETRPRPQSFAVLLHLCANAGRIVGKDELVEAVWRGVAVTDDSLVQCVADIRRALGDRGQALVRTAPKRGYMVEQVHGRRTAQVRPDASNRPSIPVLAFRPLVEETRAAMLGEGIAEDVIIELSRSNEIFVVARQSSFRFDWAPTPGRSPRRSVSASCSAAPCASKASGSASPPT